MNAYTDLNDKLWTDRYRLADLPKNGEIINIDGVGNKDAYNPSLCEYKGSKILAFRLEKRNSEIGDMQNYHPSISFAKNDNNQGWKLAEGIGNFDMLEDPSFTNTRINNQDGVLFGGVRARLVSEGVFIANTELYKGSSLETISHIPFAIINGMKDVRIHQLPDERFLLCRRPVDKNGIGSAVLHVINKLDELTKINEIIPPVIMKLEGDSRDDWVGVNNIYLLKDKNDSQWIGLLGHIGFNDDIGKKHYATITYKIKFEELINGQSKSAKPNIIAIRSCFADGPIKDDRLSDVVFPGSLEYLKDREYRLWAGLSDARIGTVIVDNPFNLE